MARGDAGEVGASASGSLCTRSRRRADPDWTIQDMLILVNEIAAVEVDCQNTLSSYQKWIIIAENCTGLGVARKSSQCRRKWESLLADFKLVKQWEAKSGVDSYWTLGCERAKEHGLPVDFDKGLYESINVFSKGLEEADTDPENDPEAAVEIDVLDAEEFAFVSGPKPKRVKHRTAPREEMIIKERKQPVSEEEHNEKPKPVVPQMEQVLSEKLEENTQLIHAILSGNISDFVNKDYTNLDEETLKTDIVRWKAEKLIECLGDLTKNLNQLCDVIGEG